MIIIGYFIRLKLHLIMEFVMFRKYAMFPNTSH